MHRLTQQEHTLVKQYPLDDILEHLKAPLSQVERFYEQTSAFDNKSGSNSGSERLKAVTRLLLTIQSHEVAFECRREGSQRTVLSELSKLLNRLQKGEFVYDHYRKLTQLVIRKAPDIDIWSAVFDLIDTTSCRTPPPSQSSFSSSYNQTPWVFSTGNFEDSSENRQPIDDALRHELLPSLRIEVPNLIHTVFRHVQHLDETAQRVFKLCQEEDYTNNGWRGWPTEAREEHVLSWLHTYYDRISQLVPRRKPYRGISRHIYRGPKTYLDGSPIKRKMDVGIAAARKRDPRDDNDRSNVSNDSIDWADILVVGELKTNAAKDSQESAWLDLATYAREVFRRQDRRFVLGFTLCGSRCRVWHFDRSGSCGSLSFDIHEDGLEFTYFMLGCHLANAETIGCDPTIEESDGKRTLNISRQGRTERLVLTQLIRKQAVIAGRGTVCWKAYRADDKSQITLIVKDAWQYTERPEEGAIIREATEKGVHHIARYYHHQTVQVNGKNDDTLTNVRGGLMEICGRRLFRQRSFQRPATSLARYSSSRTPNPSPSRKRSSDSAQLQTPSPTKRSRSSTSISSAVVRTHNRIHRLVITQDAGKPIYEATSLAAILNALTGALQGHESLFAAGFLHRDVSQNNIVLTEDECDGFLIDLDLASRVSDRCASGAPSKTGTKVFMSIGALLGEPHTFMHDLESFFWVLLWICIHYCGRDKWGKAQRRIVPQFEEWNFLPTERLASEKSGRVSKGIFNTLDKHFTDYCKPLVPCLTQLHKKVFPGGNRWFSEDRNLYTEMLDIFEDAKIKLSVKDIDSKD